MIDDFNVPPFAIDALVGKTIKAVSETFPHTDSIEFVEGAFLTMTAIPFKDGTIDVSFVPGPDAT